MISLPSAVRAFLRTRSVDMRKRVDGLSGLVEECFRQDLRTGHLFLFVNRRRQADAFACNDGIFLGSDGGVEEVASWPHTRRKFFDARSNAPRQANEILEWIRQLYDIESPDDPEKEPYPVHSRPHRRPRT